ncbi:MAG: tRNA-dihydrouridine synthase, partial [Chloroflexota bacterium]
EYCHIVKRLDGVAGVSGIELNISCPNVHDGGIAFGSTPQAAARITGALRSLTAMPLVVKLSPNVTDIKEIAAAVEAGGADAISVANTVYGMAIDTRRRAPVLANVSGGLSGPAIKPYALYLVYQVSQEVRIPVIGIGGIVSASDALEFLMAGATAIQMGTALLVDPTAWRAVVGGIRAWMEHEGVGNLREIIGAANPEYKGKAGEEILAG